MLIVLLVNVGLLVVFLFMAANIAAIRKAIDVGVLGIGATTRRCPSCAMPLPPEAAVCHRCGRDIGGWTRAGNDWWSKSADGQWFYLEIGQWKPADGSHPPPAEDQVR
jgi:hypothetical protein